MTLNGKTVVVTGGGSGMGRELVLQLIARGARVAAVDRDGTSLAETATLASVSDAALATFVLDITDREAVGALPEQVIARLGTVDGLINNAGIIQPFVRVADLADEAIERVMRVNFYGTLWMVRAVLPHLITRPEAHLVNISSMGGFLPVPGQAVYGASKAAVKLLTEALAAELANTSVKVTVVFPGAVATNITANSAVAMPASASDRPVPRMLSADKAARIILDGVERNRERILVGSDARLMDRLVRLNPVRAARLIQKQMAGLLGR